MIDAIITDFWQKLPSCNGDPPDFCRAVRFPNHQGAEAYARGSIRISNVPQLLFRYYPNDCRFGRYSRTIGLNMKWKKCCQTNGLEYWTAYQTIGYDRWIGYFLPLVVLFGNQVIHLGVVPSALHHVAAHWIAGLCSVGYAAASYSSEVSEPFFLWY